MAVAHRPVLLTEVLRYLNPQPGQRFVDGTLGGGGHTRAILTASQPTGEVLGFDRDRAALELVRTQLSSESHRLHLWHGSYTTIDDALHALDWQTVDGILLDLGLSSIQLAEMNRGFSFQSDQDLDLRFDQTRGQTAADLLNRLSHNELARILREFGELKRANYLADKIVAARRIKPFLRTNDLLVATGLNHPRFRAQLFQALRIATNEELDHLKTALPRLWRVLVPGGNLLIMSFHSLEDRIVKYQFRAWAAAGAGRLVVKKPIIPTELEQKDNPRARSAKLRIIQKVDTQ